jgi:hypothetical protein
MWRDGERGVLAAGDGDRTVDEGLLELGGAGSQGSAQQIEQTNHLQRLVDEKGALERLAVWIDSPARLAAARRSCASSPSERKTSAAPPRGSSTARHSRSLQANSAARRRLPPCFTTEVGEVCATCSQMLLTRSLQAKEPLLALDGARTR